MTIRRSARSTVLATAVALLVGMGLSLWATTAEARDRDDDGREAHDRDDNDREARGRGAHNRSSCPDGKFPASGQTTSFSATTSTQTGAPVLDDGAGQAGRSLRYRDNRNGTITDRNTKLIWEKKIAGRGCLHCVDDVYFWESSTRTTIWDWLAAVNAEGRRGFAGKSDWRIPNVKELHSIIDYGEAQPLSPPLPDDPIFPVLIDPIFGPTRDDDYWSSTSGPIFLVDRLLVSFVRGDVFAFNKGSARSVRAVRGGCVD